MVTRGHSWSLVVTRGHSWSHGHSWSLVVTRGHSWSLVVTRGQTVTRGHSLYIVSGNKTTLHSSVHFFPLENRLKHFSFLKKRNFVSLCNLVGFYFFFSVGPLYFKTFTLGLYFFKRLLRSVSLIFFLKVILKAG